MTPLSKMSSCLLYYSLHFFFVFLCTRVITPVICFCLGFFVMYTSTVECRTVFESEMCHYDRPWLLCVFLSCFCATHSVTWVSLGWTGSRLAGFSPLILLLLSVKNAGLHVYNMDILYTAKHAGPYHVAPAPSWALSPPPDSFFSFFHLFLFILF